MELLPVITDIADVLIAIDSSGVPFKQFQAGVGPYGEPQLIKLVAERLNGLDQYRGHVVTKRTPDMLIMGHWAIEFKITRPFGDNGREAEDWSVNLLHPYSGNISAIGDCYKLLALGGGERKAVVAIGYEHVPPRISLGPLLAAFELVVRDVAKIRLSARVQVTRSGLIHPVHQGLTIAAWEVLGKVSETPVHPQSGAGR